VLLTRQIRTIAKLEKQAAKHQAAVHAAEDGLRAAQNLLEAQKDKLAGIQSRLQEAEAKRDDLVANLQKAPALAGGDMEEDDPPPKEVKDPLNSLDTAVLPHICTFLGHLLSDTGTPEKLAALATTLRGQLGQHLSDPQQAAMRLLGILPDAKAPAQGTTTAALPPAGATLPLPACPESNAEAGTSSASEGLGHDTGSTETGTPALKKRATEKAKAASLRAELAAGLPAAEAAAVALGDDADDDDDDDSDPGSARRSRSPKDRPVKTRDPHEPRSPTPEH
jgi:hypothetical protein